MAKEHLGRYKNTIDCLHKVSAIMTLLQLSCMAKEYIKHAGLELELEGALPLNVPLLF